MCRYPYAFLALLTLMSMKMTCGSVEFKEGYFVSRTDGQAPNVGLVFKVMHGEDLIPCIHYCLLQECKIAAYTPIDTRCLLFYHGAYSFPASPGTTMYERR